MVNRMSFISINAVDESRDNSAAMDLKVEFEYVKFESDLRSVQPSRISAQAMDLTEWDAASTCPSDNESVLLFDSSRVQTCFVVGSSVIFRNLKPSVSGIEIDRVVKSLGIVVRANCPMFQVAQVGLSEISDFNFGFATILLSGPEEATLLNFMLHSHGMDEQFTVPNDDELDDLDFDDRLHVESILNDLLVH